MSIAQEQSSDKAGLRGVSRTKPVDAAKELVPIEELAESLSGSPLTQRGKELFGLCPLHDDHHPSLRINPERGLWYCDPCQVGGDVVELYRLYHDYSKQEAHVAAAFLLLEFGHQPPERPEGWFSKGERQKPLRDGVETARARIVQRRLFRLFRTGYLDNIEDPDLRREEAEKVWSDLEIPARAHARKLGVS